MESAFSTALLLVIHFVSAATSIPLQHDHSSTAPVFQAHHQNMVPSSLPIYLDFHDMIPVPWPIGPCVDSKGCPSRRVEKPSVGSNIPGFRYIFVDNKGDVGNQRGPRGSQVEVAGSPLTSQIAMRAAAAVVAKMTRYMPRNLFTRLASNSGVGVFTHQEKLTVFPEFSDLASGYCGSSCQGACSRTCTFDGRKIEDIAGLGGSRGVVLEDNVLCTPEDPYMYTQNILSHEFTHTIHNYALTPAFKNRITQAYNNAKAKSTWVLDSYAMSNAYEYFAEGASVFFNVNTNEIVAGGMNLCGDSQCTSEQEARNNIRRRDPDLFGVLSQVFTDDRPTLKSDLTICPSPTLPQV